MGERMERLMEKRRVNRQTRRIGLGVVIFTTVVVTIATFIITEAQTPEDAVIWLIAWVLGSAMFGWCLVVILREVVVMEGLLRNLELCDLWEASSKDTFVTAEKYRESSVTLARLEGYQDRIIEEMEEAAR